MKELTSEDVTPELLTWLDADKSRHQEVAFSWASQKVVHYGVSWLKDVLVRPETKVVERRVRLALSAPPTSDLWDTLAEIDKNLSDVYWERMNPPVVPPMDSQVGGRIRSMQSISSDGSMMHV